MERFSLRVFGVGMKDGTNDENPTHLSPEKMLVNRSYFCFENGTFFKVVTKIICCNKAFERSCFGGVSLLREHFEPGFFDLKKR